MARTADQIKDEILIELRNIILYRQELLQPTDRLDYEEFHKKLLGYAGAIYHFKERLAAWVKKRGIAVKITEIAESNTPLLVCGDLFNTKKHGGNENRSKLFPELSGMKLLTAGSPIGIRFDGTMKTGDLDRAVPYVIEIHCSENRTLGNAVRFVSKAFSVWIPIMKQIGLLVRTNNVDTRLLDELEAFAQDEP